MERHDVEPGREWPPPAVQERSDYLAECAAEVPVRWTGVHARRRGKPDRTPAEALLAAVERIAALSAQAMPETSEAWRAAAEDLEVAQRRLLEGLERLERIRYPSLVGGGRDVTDELRAALDARSRPAGDDAP